MSESATPRNLQLPASTPRVSRFAVPDLGIGVGYRVPHYREVVDELPAMDWFELLSENFMVEGGSPLHYLERLVAHYPAALHGVSMSLGSEEDPAHTAALGRLIEVVRPPWFSDHLCFTGAGGVNVHDLLPLPYRPEVRDHVVERIKRVQDRFGIPFAVENVSSYLTWADSLEEEWEFLAGVVEEADCALLLDVNNVFVSSVNHGFDPITYLDHVPVDRVVQIHLAGHTIRPEGYRIDTHDHPVCDEVWELYAHTIRRLGPVSTLIEWDGNIPEFARLQEEAERARSVRDDALRSRLAAG
ncbi:MAG: DUF692 domain-containing protein [Deltaproteobacteria bacterium]|nr:MAG: DUF692 domain-containing protein [Deltaproteobacteria bacterium]